MKKNFLKVAFVAALAAVFFKSGAKNFFRYKILVI